MNFENILLEKKNSIAYVTVNRPKVLNALNMATMEELRAAFTDIKNDAAIRVAILTGSGEKAFIAGADIGELSKHDAVSGKEYTHRGQSVLDLIENLGKPVIACINGFALGGGCEIAMACTMRLASSNAKLGQPEVKLGIIPGYGGTQRLPRLVGKGIAMQLVLTGEMISAEEAHRIGLVNEVVGPGRVDSARRGDRAEDHRQRAACDPVRDGGGQPRPRSAAGRGAVSRSDIVRCLLRDRRQERRHDRVPRKARGAFKGR